MGRPGNAFQASGSRWNRRMNPHSSIIPPRENPNGYQMTTTQSTATRIEVASRNLSGFSEGNIVTSETGGKAIRLSERETSDQFLRASDPLPPAESPHP